MKEIEGKNLHLVDINKEMKEAYLQYSMSVIVGRALPDVRDGLKPVHRRVLFSMFDLKNFHDKPYKKSARVVGDVIGKYHPHGDAAVYDTIVRMAQDFSLRYPLVDGQGNFGSIDGDSAAAQRYTEIRMTNIAEELLKDIEKETVDWSPNYDESLLAPNVLPAKIPNLLINGSSGIAVGMATNIPPHNLGEVVNGCIALVENPEISIDELMEYIKGPDFPTAAVVSGLSGIISAYKKGKGIVTIKAVSEITTTGGRDSIIVTEIPYQVNKARLIESIAELVRDKRIEGVQDIKDESSREGLRIVILLKKGQNAQVILNRLYKFTQMQISFGITLLALNSKNQPIIFNLKSALKEFVRHRQDVITKRSIFELKKAEARSHILQGLQKALDQIDEVVATIKTSKEANAAKKALEDKFGFSPIQAKAILEMRLQRLTGLERNKIQEELVQLEKRIQELKKILSSVDEINKVLIKELKEILEKYKSPRRTTIEEGADEISDEDLIKKEDMIIVLTHQGYVKRISLDEYRLQKRGGKGLKGNEGGGEEDFVSKIIFANTHTMLLILTNQGRLFWQKVYRIPLTKRTSRGRAIVNVIQVQKTENVRAFLPVEEFVKEKYMVMVTARGTVKKTSLEAFSRPRQNGIIALKIDSDDSLVRARISSPKDTIFIATEKGKSIRFLESDVRPMGRAARGVRGIKIDRDDKVIGVEVLSNEVEEILIVTSQGYGKRTPVSEFRIQQRGGSGIIAQKVTDKVGSVVSACLVDKKGAGMILATNKGQTIRMKVSDISTFGRNTQGVRLIRLKEGEFVTGATLIESENS